MFWVKVYLWLSWDIINSGVRYLDVFVAIFFRFGLHVKNERKTNYLQKTFKWSTDLKRPDKSSKFVSVTQCG